MSEKKITFDEMPKTVSWMMDKLNKLDRKINQLAVKEPSETDEQWMNLKELCEYIPSPPAEQTIYGWTSTHYIHYHKKGRRLLFLKSEIGEWIHKSKMKSQEEMREEARQQVQSCDKFRPGLLKILYSIINVFPSWNWTGAHSNNNHSNNNNTNNNAKERPSWPSLFLRR